MKLNIKITKKATKFSETDKEITNIDINNGHWKYWDDYMETDDKISLTINNIIDAHYLQSPVKDAYGFQNWESENHEIIKASVRYYDTLLDYLNCRIKNSKEEYKRKYYQLLYGEDGITFNCVLFHKEGHYFDGDVVSDVTYKKDGLIDVNIRVVE